MGLPRAAWVKLNRLRTGVGRFHSSMHKWGLASSPNCECGGSKQTVDYVLIVLTACPIHRAPHGARGLMVLNDETWCWLSNTTTSIWFKQCSSLQSVWWFWMTKLDAGLVTPLPASDSGSAAVWDTKRINPRPQSCLCLAWSGYPSNDDDDEKNHKILQISKIWHLSERQRGRVVKAPDSRPTRSRFKTHSRHSAVSLRKTLYGTFPCLMVLASSSTVN